MLPASSKAMSDSSGCGSTCVRMTRPLARSGASTELGVLFHGRQRAPPSKAEHRAPLNTVLATYEQPRAKSSENWDTGVGAKVPVAGSYVMTQALGVPPDWAESTPPTYSRPS